MKLIMSLLAAGAFAPRANQMFAKSGEITGVDGTNALVKNAVALVTPSTGTLASTAIDAMRLMDDAALSLLATETRKVDVFTAAGITDLAGKIAASGAAVAGEFMKDDLTKATSTMNVNEGIGSAHAALAAILDPQFPKFSVSGLANAIEDALIEANQPGAIVIDQPNNRVRVITGTTAQIAAFRAALVGQSLPVATFEVSEGVTSTTPAKQFGE